MMNAQIDEALSLTGELLQYVGEAERQLSSARTWSVFDMFGGGMLADLFKHAKLSKASDAMSRADALMKRLSAVLDGIETTADFRMKVGGFATFADFLFDGIFADTYMMSKIFRSLDTVRDLKQRLLILKSQLEAMRSSLT